MKKQYLSLDITNLGRITLIILLGFCVLVPIFAALNKSVTIDEPRHFYTGLKYLSNSNTFSHFRWAPKVNSYSPPLEALNTLPALLVAHFLKVNFLESVPSFYHLIFWARILTAFYSLILGLFVYRWTKELYGAKAGLLALSLYAFCPNIIAHAGLITTDLSFSCFSFIWLYYFWRTFNNYSLRNIAFSVLFFTFALLSKYSFVMFLPIYIVLCFLLWLNVPRREKKEVLFRIFQYSVILAIFGLFVLCACYRFNCLSLSSVSRHLPLISKFAHFKNIFLPIPYQYLSELKNNILVARYGFCRTCNCSTAFLMGQFSKNGFPHYYLIAFLIKNPVPTLILIVWAIYARIKDPIPRLKVSEYFLWIPALLLFLIASLQRCQIGIRHILPIYPFIFVFTGKIINEPEMRNNFLRTVFIFLIIWLILSTILIFPHYIAYFNELIGGPDKGYKYLIDSNIDWGQDIIGLKEYLKNNNVKRIKLSVFGTGIYNIEYEDILSVPTKGLIAISVNDLQSIKGYSWLKKYKPIEKIGYSIFIYDIK